MNTTDILRELKKQRGRLDDAIAALEGRSLKSSDRSNNDSGQKSPGRRRFSAAARKKMSESQKKRWGKNKNKDS